MIDTDKYEETDHPELVEFEGETLGDTLTNMLTEIKRLRKMVDEITNLIRIDEINSKCTHCGKAIEVPEGEVWSDGCWECYFEQYPDER